MSTLRDEQAAETTAVWSGGVPTTNRHENQMATGGRPTSRDEFKQARRSLDANVVDLRCSFVFEIGQRRSPMS